ncbi:hypothetical protein [Puerhibacterium puerhi]|uniref:hypothetical protein n=1 Tax=Puerhibacterium puerhi TaxID=2692623 RepID=UPI00135A5EB4|nr:hypothetical protein [Puerhibacterium puerhi]
MTDTHLSLVDGDETPTTPRVPTPADVARMTAVPVVGLPMREDTPAPGRAFTPETFTVRIRTGEPGQPFYDVENVAHWKVHDGSLSLYGPLDGDGRIVKLETINALHWTRVHRLPGGAE